MFRALGTTRIYVLLHFTKKCSKFGAFGTVTFFEALLEIFITITKLCQFYIIVKEYNSQRDFGVEGVTPQRKGLFLHTRAEKIGVFYTFSAPKAPRKIFEHFFRNFWEIC